MKKTQIHLLSPVASPTCAEIALTIPIINPHCNGSDFHNNVDFMTPPKPPDLNFVVDDNITWNLEINVPLPLLCTDDETQSSLKPHSVMLSDQPPVPPPPLQPPDITLSQSPQTSPVNKNPNLIPNFKPSSLFHSSTSFVSAEPENLQTNKQMDDYPKFTSSKLLVGHTSFVGPLTWIQPNSDLPHDGVASGSMDTLVLVWDLNTGWKFHTLTGHQNQVTDIVFDNGDLVSSSIDCTLKQWRNGQCVETWQAHKSAIQVVINLPTGELVTDTVRGLAVMSDLGILFASHDGFLRLWAKWDKIGKVVDGPEGSSHLLFDGAQYDFVFDVDIGDGMPIRKLPYNRLDNVYYVADKWLLKDGLPLSLHEQVVQFILQNSKQKDINFDASFRDPYTGSNADIQGQHSRTSDISAKPHSSIFLRN
ncbi:hypothetical protein RYX36_002977 [Vicia faba]